MSEGPTQDELLITKAIMSGITFGIGYIGDDRHVKGTKWWFAYYKGEKLTGGGWSTQARAACGALYELGLILQYERNEYLTSYGTNGGYLPVRLYQKGD